ncbi:MAG: methyltransferase [Phycisphaerae bacterium]
MIFESDSPEIRWANDLTAHTWRCRAQRTVEAACGVGLPEALADGPATAEGAAGARGLDAQAVEKVLIVLSALGLADREADAWRLTPKAEATLLPDAPLYQGNILAHHAQVGAFWADLESVLRGEEGGWVFSSEGNDRMRSTRDFVLGMHNMAMAGRAAAFCERVDLAGRRTLVDVGGGPASYAMALCERYPDLSATVLDLPEAVEMARGLIGRFGMEGRVRAEVADWNEVEFGTDVDAVLLSNVLHGPGRGAEMRLAKAYRALAPGGVLLVQDFVMNPDRTGPLVPAVFNLMVGAYSLTELRALILAAGFEEPGVQPMPEPFGSTILTAGKVG